MQINFKDKSMTFDAPLSVFDAAAAAELVTRAHIAAHVNGKLCAMTHVIDADADVELLTFEDADGKHHTYGNAPSMAMYNTAKELRERIEEVAREVFSND